MIFDSNLLSRKLGAWLDEHDLIDQDLTEYITNPLNAFLMIKRLTSGIELIRQRFPEQTRHFYEKIQNLLPSNAELNLAVEGLIGVQFIYKLRSEDFANGIIDGVVTRKPLSPHDLFVIGSEALKFDDHLHFATDYLKLAWQKFQKGFDVDDEIKENILLLQLITAYYKSRDYAKAVLFADVLVEKNPGVQKYAAIRKIMAVDLEQYGTSSFWKHNDYDV